MNLDEKNLINIHINNLSIVCRLCGTFSNDVKYISINQETLLISIKEVLNFEIIFDELKKVPENICELCYDKIDSIVKFRKTCFYWQNFWEEHLIKNLAPDEIIDNLALDFDFIPIKNDESKIEEDDTEQHSPLDSPETNNEDDENKCTTRNGLTYHSNAHKFIRINKNNQFVCNFCQKTFKWRFNAEIHIRRHTKETPFSCELCEGKYFSNIADLSKHKKLSHLGLEYKCTTCGRNFTRKYLLRNHELEHSGPPSIPCSLCDKLFYIQSALKNHLNNFHVDRNFMCDVCPKMFKTKARLKDHAIRHTSSPKHDCNKCERKFYSGQELKVHIKNHSKEFPFKCNNCDMSFKSKKGLCTHLKICKK